MLRTVIAMLDGALRLRSVTQSTAKFDGSNKGRFENLSDRFFDTIRWAQQWGTSRNSALRVDQLLQSTFGG